MSSNILRGIRAGAKSKLLDANDLYWSIFSKGAPGLALIVLLMWAVNAYWVKELNYVFFFTGLLFLAFIGFSPKAVLTAMGAGVAVQTLRDEDITQGAVKGITTLYQVVLGVMLWFAIVAGILAVVPFEAKPSAFFPIAAMLLLMTLAFASVKNKLLKGVIVAFAISVIGYHLWYVVPEEWKPKKTTPAVQVQTPRQDDWYGKTHTVKVTKNGPVQQYRLAGGRCVQWWGKDMSVKEDTFTTYVRGSNDQDLIPLAEYRKKYPGRKGKFGWFSFEPVGEEAEVNYAFYKTGECR